MKDTKIEWCDHSWSPWRGCTKVSPGCANCYAETLSKRNPAVLGQWGKGKPRVLAKNWKDPVKWNREAKENLQCLVCGATRFNDGVHADGYCSRCELDAHPHRSTVFPSLCDWLDDEVPVEWLAQFIALIHATPNLNWLLLTKRPENWKSRLWAVIVSITDGTGKDGEFWQWLVNWHGGIPPSNVWVGTSIEDQTRADERIPALLKIPAVGRFLSVEPLLGPVDLAASVKAKEACPRCTPPTDPGCPYCLGTGGVPIFHNGAIHLAIIGGESGPGARGCDVQSVRSLVQQCKAASVPCFVKQLGAKPTGIWTLGAERPLPDFGWKLRIKHPKGGDPAEWPEDLRVREFPEGLR